MNTNTNTRNFDRTTGYAQLPLRISVRAQQLIKQYGFTYGRATARACAEDDAKRRARLAAK